MGTSPSEPDHRMTADQLRAAWYSFFEARGHERRPAASLVPENDPTLLFTGAGMNQFKEFFTGTVKPPCPRAMTVQPCFRQGDLENVGRTPRHLTFFEMLGHFSFGDYFKEDAIAWAWEFLTKEAGAPADKLFVSIYEDDDQAFHIWRNLGVPRGRISRFDAVENFWPADAPRKGPNGVCGPCSEVYFDYGEHRAKGDGGPNEYDSGRFVEIWNSVFTQYDRRGVDDLVPLPQKNIDCGVGYERLLALIEGQYSVFTCSLFRPLIDAIVEITGRAHPFHANGDLPEGEDPRRIRRVADHARAGCFLVADGVRPSNEGRGYVLRRVLRRAIRDGIQLGLDDPFLSELVGPVVGTMRSAYPDLDEGVSVMRSVFEAEEAQFRRTYAQGVKYLEAETGALHAGAVLDGRKAFKLYDTYGFPLDLAERILAGRGIRVDHAGFEQAMGEQQTRARAGSKIEGAIFVGGPLNDLKSADVAPTEFVGHDRADGDLTTSEARGVEAEASVVGLIVDGALTDALETGAKGTVVLDRTPFYGESGGQVGDVGLLVDDASGIRVRVLDTRVQEKFFLHEAVVETGRLETGMGIFALVDEAARDAVRRNHTATHLLHAALRQVLGNEVRQEGSLVAADRLRFDFRHPRAMTDEQVEATETLVNEWILRNDLVRTEVLPLEEAKASGAMSLFGEKYEDQVRVVSLDSGSCELCGGTHCRRTGDIGSFRVASEAAIASGVRRIEAATGLGALAMATRDRGVVRELSSEFKATPEEVVDRVRTLQSDLRAARKAEEKNRREAGLQVVDQLVASAREMEGVRVQTSALPGVDGKALRGIWDGLKRGGVDVAVLVGEAGGKAPLLVGLSPVAVERGLDARALLETAASVLGGRGGGRPEMAQGQGTDAARAEAALTLVAAELEKELAKA